MNLKDGKLTLESKELGKIEITIQANEKGVIELKQTTQPNNEKINISFNQTTNTLEVNKKADK